MRTPIQICAFALLLFAAHASAQQYGQWSWQATLGAGQRSYLNTLNGEAISDFKQRDLRFFVGINGFILHPSIAAFSVGVDTSVNRYPTQSAVDTNRRGYQANLSILPSSIIPIQIYAARESYAYRSLPLPDETGDFPRAAFYSLPDSGTSYGGRFRFRGRFLGGLEGAADRTTTDFLDGVGREKWSRDFLNWSHGSRSWQQNFRLERQDRVFVSNAYHLSDLIGTADEQGIAGRWVWSVSANALRREFSSPAFPISDITVGRSTSVLMTNEPGRNSWRFSEESDYTRASDSSVDSHRVDARYTFAPRRGFQWAPGASYTLQNLDRVQVHAPGASVSAIWIGARGPFDVSASSNVGVLRLTSSDSSLVPTRNQATYGGGILVGHTTNGNLRERFDANASKNDLRTSPTIEGQPAFGVVGLGGTEDTRQARFTVNGRVSALSINGYSDWASRESTIAQPGGSFSSTTLLHSLQLVAPRLTLNAMMGSTTVTTQIEQKIRFVGGGLSVTPFQFISFFSNYRQDHRDVLLEPRINGERLEAGASIRVGAFYLNPLAFWLTERVAGGDERKNRGLTMSLTRRFGGFLPIISAPKRRGSIQ